MAHDLVFNICLKYKPDGKELNGREEIKEKVKELTTGFNYLNLYPPEGSPIPFMSDVLIRMIMAVVFGQSTKYTTEAICGICRYTIVYCSTLVLYGLSAYQTGEKFLNNKALHFTRANYEGLIAPLLRRIDD